MESAYQSDSAHDLLPSFGDGGILRSGHACRDDGTRKRRRVAQGTESWKESVPG